MVPIEKFERAFQQITINRGNQYTKEIAPHQPCLLLAVIEAIESGDIKNNKIRYEPRLLERFDKYFKIVRPQHDEELKAHYPFVYLNSNAFWILHRTDRVNKPYTSRERNQLALSGPRRVSEEVEFVSLDDDLYECLLDTGNRHRLRNVIIDKWLANRRDQIQTAIHDVQQQNQSEPLVISRGINLNRDSKFRRAVLDAYGYRCAATGWQLKVGNSSCLLEAAHIYPLAEEQDNRPQNGIALTPTIHKAMDNFLIAPGPDYLWHTSEFLRDEAKTDDGAEWLLTFDGNQLLLPKDKKLRPTPSVLEWRMDHLQ